MMRETTAKWMAGLMCVIALGGCAAAPEEEQENGAEPVSVENRVKVGEDNWVVEYGSGSRIAEAGTIESFEVVNNTTEEIKVPDAGLDNSAFIIIVNDCVNRILKPGQSCILRGEWATKNAREATLNVAVSKPDEEEAVKERISVPLEASASEVAPTARTVSPTPAPTFTPSPTPSGTSTTMTPTPTGSTASGSAAPTPSVVPPSGGTTGK
jgi:hypothetical protein